MKRRDLYVSCILVVALNLQLLIATVAAQEARGSITGRVSDATGAVVAGARLTITNVSMNTSTTINSDADGNYSAFYLMPGKYSVTVEAQGFKKYVNQGIEVRVGDKLTLDLQLEVGGVEQTVSVIASTPLLESSSASAGSPASRTSTASSVVATPNQLAPSASSVREHITAPWP